MEYYKKESITWYSVYSKPLFAYDAYFQIDVSLRDDRYGKNTFQFGIKAVPLKTTSMDLELYLHVSQRLELKCKL